MESGLDLRASEKRRRRIIDFVLCWGVEQQKSRERERARKSFFHMQPFKVILCFLPSRLRWIYSNMRAPCCVCSEDTVRMQKFLNFGARPAKICMHLFDIQKHSSAGRKLCKRLQICPFLRGSFSWSSALHCLGKLKLGAERERKRCMSESLLECMRPAAHTGSASCIYIPSQKYASCAIDCFSLLLT